MRLDCPACGAAYEAPDGAVPEAGRWVRCGACRAEWLARPSSAAAAPKAEARRESEVDAVGPETPEGDAAPALGAARDAPSDAPPDASLDPPRDAPATAARGPALSDAGAPHAMAQSFETASGGEDRGSAGLMALVACLGLLALAAVLAYLRHDAIAAAAPQLAEPLSAYVAFVDELRGIAGGE